MRLLHIEEKGYRFEEAKARVTAKALMNSGENPLLLSIKVKTFQ